MDEAAAIAALIALGVDPTLAAAMVAHWAAEKLARREDVDGKLVPRREAVLLREKIAATKEQTIKKLLPLDAARDALKSYDLPAANVEALLAAWAAKALKTVLPP